MTVVTGPAGAFTTAVVVDVEVIVDVAVVVILEVTTVVVDSVAGLDTVLDRAEEPPADCPAAVEVAVETEELALVDEACAAAEDEMLEDDVGASEFEAAEFSAGTAD